MARALIKKPDILIMDEAASNLDRIGRRMGVSVGQVSSGRINFASYVFICIL